MPTLDFAGRSPERERRSPGEVRLTGARGRMRLGMELPPGEETGKLVRASVVTNADEWSNLMVQNGTIRGIGRRAQRLKNSIPEGPGIPAAVHETLDGIIQTCDNANANNPPDAFPIFIALGEIERTVASLRVPGSAARPLDRLLAFARASIEDLSPGRTEMIREGHQGKTDSGDRIGQIVPLTVAIIGLGGILGAGIIKVSGGPVNKKLVGISFGLLAASALGGRLSTMFQAPGTEALRHAAGETQFLSGQTVGERAAQDSLMNALGQVRFMGEAWGPFERLSEQYGIRGRGWGEVARGVYENADEMRTIAAGRPTPMTPEQLESVVALAPNGRIERQLRRMAEAQRIGHKQGQDLRDFLGLLLNANTPDAQNVVFEYFNLDASRRHVAEILTATDGART